MAISQLTGNERRVLAEDMAGNLERVLTALQHEAHRELFVFEAAGEVEHGLRVSQAVDGLLDVLEGFAVR